MMFGIFVGGAVFAAAVICMIEVVNGSSSLVKWLDKRIAESEGEKKEAFEEVKGVVQKKPWKR